MNFIRRLSQTLSLACLWNGPGGPFYEFIRAGANLYHVKELLDHESLETLKYYAKFTITDLRTTHRKCHPREQRDRGRSHSCGGPAA